MCIFNVLVPLLMLYFLCIGTPIRFALQAFGERIRKIDWERVRASLARQEDSDEWDVSFAHSPPLNPEVFMQNGQLVQRIRLGAGWTLQRELP